MSELIDVYTEDGIKTGAMSKREYYSIGNESVPWINCTTCFVIDDTNKKILFEKRGNSFLDPGKLDLCSGHVKSGEVSFQGMIRELGEELSIPENLGCNLKQIGRMKVDYTSLGEESSRKWLKCFVDVFALKLQDISKIKVDNNEAVSFGWLNLEDSIGFIKNGMTRMPYEDSLEKQYSNIFEELKNYMLTRQTNEKIKY